MWPAAIMEGEELYYRWRKGEQDERKRDVWTSHSQACPLLVSTCCFQEVNNILFVLVSYNCFQS